MRLNTLHKYILNKFYVSYDNYMCPMATLNKLFLGPMQVYVELFNGFKWRKVFPSKNNIWQPYWIFYSLSFSNFSKCLEEDPK